MSNKSTKDVQEAIEILPAWFIDRMMTDSWLYGLLMSNGMVLSIACILEVHQAANGEIWIDVLLTDSDLNKFAEIKPYGAPTSRTTASINTAHIIAAVELADT